MWGDTYSPTASHLLYIKRAYSSILIIIKIFRGLAVSQRLNYLCEDGIFTMKIISLWCLTSLSAIFRLYRDGQFYWWSNENNLKK